MILDVLDSSVTQQECSILSKGAELKVLVVTPVKEAIKNVAVMIEVTIIEAIELIKATVVWSAVDVAETLVPFTQHVGLVAQALQDLRCNLHVLGKTIRSVCVEYTMLLANVEGVLTGQDGTTRWGAHRGHIVVLNDHSFAGKLINDWRLDGAVMEAHIIVAKVIN